MPEPEKKPDDQKKKPTPIAIAAEILKGLGTMFPQGGGGGASGFPGMPGAVISPVPVPGPTVQQPRMGGVPGTAMTGGMAMPGGGVPIAAQPPQYLQEAMRPPQTQAPPLPASFYTGFEFESKGGRNAAIAAGAIANVTQALAQRKQMKEDRERAEAANWLGQVFDAQQRGDNKMLDILLTNEKMVKKADSALAYTFPRVPGEPTPPEALGLQDALKSQMGKGQIGGTVTDMMGRLPKPGTPGGIMLPQPSAEERTRAAASQALLEGIQSGRVSPEQLMAAAFGPQFALPADEFKQATKIQFGLELAPADIQKMDLTTQQALKMSEEDFKKTVFQEIAAFQRLDKQLGSDAALTKLVRGSIAGLQTQRLKFMENLADKKAKGQFNLMGKEAINNARQLAKMNADLATKILNSTKDEENPEYKRYLQESERNAKRAEELEMLMQTDLDELLKNVIGGEE